MLFLLAGIGCFPADFDWVFSFAKNSVETYHTICLITNGYFGFSPPCIPSITLLPCSASNAIPITRLAPPLFLLFPSQSTSSLNFVMLTPAIVLLTFLLPIRAPACHSDCVTCSNPSANHCTSCATNAQLTSTGDGNCVCSGGWYTTTDAQQCNALCDVTCLTCTGAGPGNCASCKPNANLSGSTCACAVGFVGTADNCVGCDSTCLTCSAGGPSGCTGCKTGAVPANAGATFACVCNAGFFPNPSPANCSTCSGLCQECVASGAQNCSVCKPAAHLSNPPVSPCVCDPTYFPSPTVAACSSCNPACGNCTGPLISSCTSCPADAYLVHSPPAACACAQGFFTLSDASACSPCDSTCATCSNSSNTDCILCKPGALLDSSTPPVCVCGLGYTPTLTSANCVKAAISCDASCLLCTVVSSPTDCSSCFPNAVLTAGNSCVCLTNSYPNPDVANCSLCHSTCAACVTSASADFCTLCYSNAHLFITSPSACVCDDSFFPNTDSSSCQACSSLCETCVGSNADQCFSCKSFAVLSDISPASCVCSDGSYPNPDVSSCSLCDQSCQLCVIAGDSGCTQCKSGAFLSGPSPSSCVCSPGFYPGSDPGSCVPCSSECLTCSSATECTSCKDNATLLNGNCACAENTYQDSVTSNCVLCSAGCKTCLLIGCLTCEADWNLLNSACYQTCPPGFSPVSGLCSPIDTSPPVPTLTASANNTLFVNFDRDMHFTLLSSDLSIEVSDSASNLYEAVWPDPEATNPRQISIPLTFNVTYLPATTANLTFLSPAKVTDLNGVSIETEALSVGLQAYGTVANKSQTTGAMARAVQTTVSATVSTSLASSFISGQYASLWKVLNEIQIISYIPMGATPIPDTLKQMLLSLNMNTPFSSQAADLFAESNDCFTAAAFTNDYSISSVSFFASSNVMLTVILLLSLIHLAARYLSTVRSPSISALGRRAYTYFTWGVPLRWWIQCYLDLGILGMVQMYNFYIPGCFAVPSFLISALVAVTFVGLFVASPVIILVFTIKTYRLMAARTDERFNSRWGLLFLTFKETATAGNLAYYTIFFMRRMVFGVVTVWLQSASTMQAVLNSACSLCVSALGRF